MRTPSLFVFLLCLCCTAVFAGHKKKKFLSNPQVVVPVFKTPVNPPILKKQPVLPQKKHPLFAVPQKKHHAKSFGATKSHPGCCHKQEEVQLKKVPFVPQKKHEPPMHVKKKEPEPEKWHPVPHKKETFKPQQGWETVKWQPVADQKKSGDDAGVMLQPVVYNP
eukprot:GDKI01042843.1.p1 GENE.GDKI01042843.1~~GDKI01042843.1.p1  ORF type:complete len:190 (+),score=49.27 GDKI01042843.1:81-572(+)